MDCILIYKGKEYKHEEFLKYMDSHPKEFSANEFNPETSVQSRLKVINALVNPKALNLFDKFYKSNPDKFYNELLQLGSTKNQVDLLKNQNKLNNPQSIQDMIISFAANMSYTVEINTTKEHNYRPLEDDDISKGLFTDEELDTWRKEPDEVPTSHYANLTVPGGTNYTENEIAIPGITPSIKGHAQFSTDNGIGWFRSDNQKTGGKWYQGGVFEGEMIASTTEGGTTTKSRRILEVQSDLFQKGRDKEVLTGSPEFQRYIEETEQDAPASATDRKEANQFLQLLNKDGNWIPFFIKSIVQDSAKKGYEKVLFPTGDTASKVEGHTTLEEFKREKEERIKELEFYINSDEPKRIKEQFVKEKEQLQEELKRVESEGFAALKPIYDFYENRVKNTLNKIYGKDKVERIKDEYDNEWYQINIDKKRDNSTIFFQTENIRSSKASLPTLEKVTEFLKRNGFEIEALTKDMLDVKGNKITPENSINFLDKIVKVIDGEQASSLPEEAMHLSVRIMKEKNPKLFKEMMNRVGTYNLYEKVLSEYRDLKDYQIDGKPNIPKIKEETVGKILTEYVIKTEDGLAEKPELIAQSQSWWNKIIDGLKSFFAGAGFNPFKTAAKEFDKQSTEGIELGEDKFKQQNSEKGEKVFNKIKSTVSSIKKVVNADGNSHYETSDGVKVAKRVTDFAKEFLTEKFRNREINIDQVKEWETKRQVGVAGHADIDDILARFVDKETGLPRRDNNNKLNPNSQENLSQINPEDNQYYSLLEEYIGGNKVTGKQGLIDKYPVGTRFMWEEMVYKPGKKGAGIDDEAGTLDFIAIEPDGTTHNLDWKFLDIKPYQEDLKWYSKKAYNIQLSRYGNILRDTYGVENLKESRIIPIKTKYTKKGEEYVFSGIELGDLNTKDIIEEYLLPYASSVEKTGDKKIDDLVSYLNKFLDTLERTSVKGKEKQLKLDRINDLSKSIRHLQVKGEVDGLLKFGKLFVANKLNSLKKYQDIIKENKVSEMTTEQVENASFDLIEAYYSANTYANIEQKFKNFFDKNDPNRKELLDNLQDLSSNAIDLQEQVKDIIGDFGEKSIANRANVYGLIKAEKNVKLLTKWLNTSSSARTKSTQVFAKMVSDAWQDISIDLNEEVTKLEGHKEKINDWIKATGDTDRKKLNNLLFQKDAKGKFLPELVGKFDKQFYNKLREAQDSRNREWIKDNIDIKRYKEDYETKLENYSNWANDYYGTTGTAEEKIEEFKNRYDIEKTPLALSKANDQLYKYPLEKWHSAEFKEMNQAGNESILSLYNYMVEKNREAHDIGLFSSYHSTFFPQVRKGFVEGLTYGIDKDSLKSAIKAVGSGFIMEPGEQGYIDPLTGEPQDKIFARYMADLGEVSRDINGNQSKDYSGVSDDIFTVLTLWNNEMLKYKYLSNIEGRSKLLSFIEQSKNHLATDQIGRIIKENGQIKEIPGNATNMDYFKKYMDFALYGKRFNNEGIGFKFDYNNKAKNINKFLGSDVMPLAEEDELFISAPKAMETFNRYFALKTLGVNIASSISNLFGGTANSYINAGKYITRKDLLVNQHRLISAKFMSGDGEKFAGLLEYFVPFTEDLSRELGRKMSFSNFKKYLSSDTIMTLMRRADRSVQMVIAGAYFDNTTVIDGKLVNIREYVKEKNDFDNIYKLPASEREAKFKSIEDQINELKKQAISKTVVVDGDKITIPGVEKNDDSIRTLRSQILQMTRDSLGNRTPEELAQINMTMLGGSFTMFKNWIPRLAQKRFGELAYTPGSQSYEWGRVRMLGQTLSGNILSSTRDLIAYMGGSLKAEDNLINIAERLYSKKVREQRELEQVSADELSMFEQTMTQAEFTEMYLKGVKAQMFEILSMMSLMGMYYGAKANANNHKDDDYKTKGMYKWTVRMLDKLSDELGFFYSPNSAQQIVGGKLIPSITILGDIQNFFLHGAKEIWYDVNGDEEAAEKNKVIKHILKDIPVEKELMYYRALYSEEFAKEHDIKTSANYSKGN